LHISFKIFSGMTHPNLIAGGSNPFPHPTEYTFGSVDFTP